MIFFFNPEILSSKLLEDTASFTYNKQVTIAIYPCGIMMHHNISYRTPNAKRTSPNQITWDYSLCRGLVDIPEKYKRGERGDDPFSNPTL